MTIGGELDGLARISRFAEAFFNQGMNKSIDFNLNIPVYVVPGMTHMQFADGDVPILVKTSDLTPTISTDDAQTQVALIVADFVS